ncbi:MAG TPA: hypothetical protein VH643_38140 [Gemmataceae bacterium]|jgi:hypothetical protein
MGKAETVKREKKRMEGIETKNVDISAALFNRIDAEGRRAVAAALGVDGPEDIGNRDLLSAAVASYLADIVSRLAQAGLVRQPKGKQRPRAIDSGAWQCLVEAEKLVDVHAVSLARAALVLLAQKGVASVDLQACREALAAHGAASSEKPKAASKRRR